MSEVVQQDTATSQSGGAGGDQTAKETVQGDAKGETQPKSAWYEGYPEDIREDLKGYDKPETLAKEFVSLKKKFVVPEKPEDYEFGTKEFNEANKQMLTTWRAKAKEFGLTKEQFAKLTEYEVATMQATKQRLEKAQAEEAKKGVAELQQEWGKDFDAKIQAAKKTMQSIFPQSFSNFLENSKLGNHPEMVRAMVKLAESVSEDVLFKAQTKTKRVNRDPQTGEPMLTFTSMK